MKKVTEEDFFELIKNNNTIEGYTFDIHGENIILNENNLNSEILYFKDCTFNGSKLSFENINNSKLILSFEHCTINCELSIFNCQIKVFSLIDIKKLNSLNIIGLNDSPCEFEIFQFHNGFTRNPIYTLESNIYISNCVFKNGNLRIEKITHKQGSFTFSNNVILNDDDKLYKSSIFNDSYLSFANFTNNKFETSVDFKNVTFYNNNFFDVNKNESEANPNVALFLHNNFKNVKFTNSNFIQFSQFISCNFNGKIDFSNTGNIKDSILLFSECEFNGITYFNDCKINTTTFNGCSFEKTTTFNNSKFNKLFFIKVKFDKAAYFDYLTIRNLNNRSFLKTRLVELNNWKITLRTIKQELQKTENRIDFNRFRSYEMAAYYKELNWSSNFKDKFILCATKHSTDFGNSWTKAFWFTIISGLIWFLILYRIENTGSFNPAKANDFFVGAFRFFLVTDFYNPLLENSKIYLTNSYSWLVFIIGKIFIAFGIYEMVQSFRKFKA